MNGACSVWVDIPATCKKRVMEMKEAEEPWCQLDRQSCSEGCRARHCKLCGQKLEATGNDLVAWLSHATYAAHDSNMPPRLTSNALVFCNFLLIQMIYMDFLWLCRMLLFTASLGVASLPLLIDFWQLQGWWNKPAMQLQPNHVQQIETLIR